MSLSLFPFFLTWAYSSWQLMCGSDVNHSWGAQSPWDIRREQAPGRKLVLGEVERAGYKRILLEGHLGGVRKVKVKSELERNGEKIAWRFGGKESLLL